MQKETLNNDDVVAVFFPNFVSTLTDKEHFLPVTVKHILYRRKVTITCHAKCLL